MKKITTLICATAATILLGACGNKPKTEEKQMIDVNWCTFNIRYDEPKDSLLHLLRLKTWMLLECKKC